MWTCPKCGERIEAQFDSCWKCAASPEPNSEIVITARHWKRAFLLGLTFECVLVLLCFVLPADSVIGVKTRNFALHIHHPAWEAVSSLDVESAVAGIILVLLAALVMVFIWGLLISLGLGLFARGLDRFKVSKRQRRNFGFGLTALLVIALVWAVIGAGHARPIPFTPSKAVGLVVEGNTAFALDLYQKLKDQPGNLIFSPYSISAETAMTCAGARGQTETEMSKALHFNLSQEQLHPAFGALTARMEDIQRWNRITLSVVNSLWCQRDYRFTDSFLKLAGTDYHAEASLVDFKSDPEAARGEINSWVERKTKNKIKGVINSVKLDPATRLVLCNAIYFKGKWDHPFDKANTKSMSFHSLPNKTVDVPTMMNHRFEFKAIVTDDLSLLELPYVGKDLSMIIFLPETVDGLPGLERQFNTNNITKWLAELDESPAHKLTVWLPRFQATQTIELKAVLQSLGMSSLFSSGVADLSGMTGTRDLFIFDAIHKAFIEVNESGTEAAAVTFSLAMSASIASSFRADHPFIYIIRENGSGSILFLGRIVDPTKP